MRVFLAVASLRPDYGGPARSISRTAIALSQAGIDVGVWAADQSAPSTPFLEGSTGPRLEGSPATALSHFGRPDILHDNGIWSRHHHQLARLAFAQRIPRLVSTRGMLEPWALRHKAFKKRLAWWSYQRRDLLRAARHHATTTAEAVNLERLRLGVPISVIPNGIHVPVPVPLERSGDHKTALFLGRIYPVKGLPMLIAAWARVRPAGWRLHIAGPDEAGHRSEIEALVRNFGLKDVVAFTGPLEGHAKHAALCAANLFILPSHSESFGMAIGEALACSLPVLTTTAAPWPGLQARQCGWQVAPTVEAITHGLETATSLPLEELRSMGARGRAFVATDFEWTGIAREFVKTYEEILAR